MSYENNQGCLGWLLSLFQSPTSTTQKPTPPAPPKPQQYTPPAPQQYTPPTPQPVTPPPAPKPQPETKVEKHRVAGITFHLDAIKAMGRENFDYDRSKRELIDDCLTGERIYRTDYFANVTTLEPEPDNPEDPKAIKVVVDGVHIGYIKAGSCAHIHKVMREGRLESVKCEIKGGPYKILLEDYDADDLGEPTYTLERDTAPMYAELYITVKTTK